MTIGAARLFLLVALASVVAPVQSESFSIQIMNPDQQTAVRVFLDRKLIFEGKPVPSNLIDNPSLPALAGTFGVDAQAKHVLIVEAPSTHTKAQLEWKPSVDASEWIVIHYYPGRDQPEEPPFFTFSLQETPYKLK